MKRKVVYIAHPLNASTRQGIEHNRTNAAQWAAWAAMTQNVSPVCDWIVLSGVLSEEHRAVGLECDLALIERVDEVWLCGGRVSPGMAIERDHAKLLGKPIVSFLHLGYEAPLLDPLGDDAKAYLRSLSSGTVGAPEAETA